jgi:hypothetical protein
MKGFYRELRSGKDVSPSLRGAMLKMIRMGAKFMNGPSYRVTSWNLLM